MQSVACKLLKCIIMAAPREAATESEICQTGAGKQKLVGSHRSGEQLLCIAAVPKAKSKSDATATSDRGKTR